MIRRLARRGLKVASTAGRVFLRGRMWVRGFGGREVALAPLFDRASSIRFLAVGRQGYGNLSTERIAASMERVAREAPTHGVLYLGDNFYPKGVRSVDDPQWQYKFERLYAGKYLGGMPFFAVVGNHDAEGVVDAQLEYARGRFGSARWQMDGPFYVRDFGRSNGNVLARAVFLDTVALLRDPTAQLQFLEAAFGPGCPATWRIVVGHYGFRSLTNEPYTRRLTLSHLLPELQALAVDLCVTANDRFQQVLDRRGEPLHLSANGGGDKAETGLRAEDPQTDFVSSQGGFGVITVDDRAITVELRDVRGALTHRRRREK